MKLDKFFLFILACLIPTACADLNYTEENSRDEEWNYEYFVDGIKNMVFDVYAQVYSGEFDSNSAYFLAAATDEAQYALETGAVNNYVNGGWSLYGVCGGDYVPYYPGFDGNGRSYLRLQ